MRYFLLITLTLFVLASCGGSQKKKEKEIEKEVIDTLSVIPIDKPAKVDSVELKSSVKKIEAKYGAQWDFCDCVVKGDSINKAFQKTNIPDAEFDRLSDRFDEIDKKCQAFRIQDANKTPEQRALHEKKVKKCLKAAGIK
ncbi:MAG: hypothetical protein V4638_05775 [Bacteroidota bacterium]